jgi:hypothetical protein
MATRKTGGATEGGSGRSTGTRIEGFAEDFGKVLGTARARAEGWISRRQEIVRHLTDLRDTASKLLVALGHEAERAIRHGRAAGRRGTESARRGAGRPPGSGKKKRTMSVKARKAISDAQKKRRAAQKAGMKKKRATPRLAPAALRRPLDTRS